MPPPLWSPKLCGRFSLGAGILRGKPRPGHCELCRLCRRGALLVGHGAAARRAFWRRLTAVQRHRGHWPPSWQPRQDVLCGGPCLQLPPLRVVSRLFDRRRGPWPLVRQRLPRVLLRCVRCLQVAQGFQTTACKTRTSHRAKSDKRLFQLGSPGGVGYMTLPPVLGQARSGCSFGVGLCWWWFSCGCVLGGGFVWFGFGV